MQKYQLAPIRVRDNAPGSAVTELILCLLPYLLVIFGMILIAQLQFGRQEAIKASIWAGQKIGNVSQDDVEKNFFRQTQNVNTSKVKFDKKVGVDPDASDQSEEPVLPYDKNDMDAGAQRFLTKFSQTVVIGADGAEIKEEFDLTSEGRYLKSIGIIESDSTAKTAKFIDPYGEYVAEILGSTITYSESATEFTYKLPVRKLTGVGGGGELHSAEDSEAVDAFHANFTILPEQYFSASLKEDGQERGRHGYSNTISLKDLSDYGDGINMSLPRPEVKEEFPFPDAYEINWQGK